MNADSVVMLLLRHWRLRLRLRLREGLFYIQGFVLQSMTAILLRYSYSYRWFTFTFTFTLIYFKQAKST